MRYQGNAKRSEAKMTTICILHPDEASFIASMPQLAGNGHRVDIHDGGTITLSADALAVLAELPEDNDGHYDGSHIWVGGIERPVYTVEQLLAEIAEQTTAIGAAEQTIAERTTRRDELIRAALRTELARAAIASAARVSEARLYQIRDGRR